MATSGAVAGASPSPPSWLTAVEAAFEAWAECGPVRHEVSERRALSLLLTLGAHLPGREQGLGTRAKLLESLLPGGDDGSSETAPAMQLRAIDGKVHFLHFWQAFSQLARQLFGFAGEAAAVVHWADGLLLDVEEIRDAILQRQSVATTGTVAVGELISAVQVVEAKSVTPAFWQAVLEGLHQSDTADVMNDEATLEEVTVLLLSWLHDATMWQHVPAIASLNTGLMMPAPSARGEPSHGDIAALVSARDGCFSPRGPGVDGQMSCASGAAVGMMTSQALMLDLEEHWRAAGQFDKHLELPSPGRLRPLYGTMGSLPRAGATPMTPLTPVPSSPHGDGSERSPLLRHDRTLTPSSDLLPVHEGGLGGHDRNAFGVGGESPRAVAADVTLCTAATSPPSPPSPPGLPPPGQAECPPQPLDEPIGMQIQNLRTAMVPLLSTLRSPGEGTPQRQYSLASDGGAHGHCSSGGSPRTRAHLHTAMVPLDETPRAPPAQLAGWPASICSQPVSSRGAPLGPLPLPGRLSLHSRPAYMVPEDGFESPRAQGLPVRLHIYDVSQEASIRRLNALLAHKRSPLKFGGVFHAGVEVNGKEWYFAACSSGTGIRCVEPTKDPEHQYRQTVPLAPTPLAESAIDVLLQGLKAEYTGPSYDLLRRNCCHFADDLCQRLGVGAIPGWVYRLARLGARVDAVLLRGNFGSRFVEGGNANAPPEQGVS
eukprot:TRINITY_DN90488_c0_g1_i1.p1 TRINITY_DN90488_c0_g1~~TRINITY_DN90488_c0_g1_i1.p1  ORF type:complete len:748 (+),score=129.17 TRINITY_DN90488_c0_g1_i1:111-2246(+)